MLYGQKQFIYPRLITLLRPSCALKFACCEFKCAPAKQRVINGNNKYFSIKRYESL